MVFDLDLKNERESNSFLRALWSNFSEKYGKCAWQYMPNKNGKKKTIFLGFMDIGIQYTFLVYVCYERKSAIKKIGFVSEINDKKNLMEITNQFKNIIEETKKLVNHPKTTNLRVAILSYSPIASYHSNYFTINPCKNGLSEVSLRIDSYGDNDAKLVFQVKVERLLNILSALTNLPFNISDMHKNVTTYKYEEEFGESDFIDGHSIKNEHIVIPEYGKKLIDNIIKLDIDIDDDLTKKLLNAVMHFHAGRKFDAQINDVCFFNSTKKTEVKNNYIMNFLCRDKRLLNAREVSTNILEIATVSYISALEVLSTIVCNSKAERCEKCGQLTYGISSRVKNMLYKYFDEPVAKQIHGYYNSRSKFLHEGKLLTYPYIGVSIPQLDCNSISGCKVNSEIPLINLREFTSYCIRKVIKEYFVE